MKKDERVVYGSYGNPDETVAAIRQLQDKGYGKDEITLYSSADRTRSFDKTEENTEVKDERQERSFDKIDENRDESEKEGSFDRVDKKQDKNEDDESIWEQVKDMFTRDTYDYQENSNEFNEDDILYSHRADLADGHHIIVLDRTGRDQI